MTILVVEGSEMFVKLADEGPVVGVVHLCYFEHLYGMDGTSKMMPLMRRALVAYCIRLRLMRYSW